MPLIGRNKLILELIHLLKDERVSIINIYGIKGIGKSRLGEEICSYLSERNKYQKGGIHKLEMTNLVRIN